MYILYKCRKEEKNNTYPILLLSPPAIYQELASSKTLQKRMGKRKGVTKRIREREMGYGKRKNGEEKGRGVVEMIKRKNGLK